MAWMPLEFLSIVRFGISNGKTCFCCCDGGRDGQEELPQGRVVADCNKALGVIRDI